VSLNQNLESNDNSDSDNSLPGATKVDSLFVNGVCRNVPVGNSGKLKSFWYNMNTDIYVAGLQMNKPTTCQSLVVSSSGSGFAMDSKSGKSTFNFVCEVFGQ
jgi:hypothetical protein